MGLFVVMPLWLVYEVLRLIFVPDEMNGAEYYLMRALDEAVPINLLRIAVAVAVFCAAWSIHRRQIPWVRVGLVIVLEGCVYALMLGPIAQQLTHHALFLSVTPPVGRLVADLVGSLGAGIYEEIVFRLGLMSALGWCFMRASQAFSIPKWIGCVLAIVASALLFSLFHYISDERALVADVFMFRTVAGVLLGGLFVTRGIGVCIYTHAMYDVFLYLQRG